MATDFPIQQVREEFPAVQRIEKDHFVGYFDGPGGTQIAKSVIEAMATYMKNGVSNLGGSYPTALHTAFLVEEAREHAAILLGADKENIAFGANMTTLAFRISRALGEGWTQGRGNIVVTEMDHHANIDPWKTAARSKNIAVHTIPLDVETKTLDLSQLEKLITKETELVAIGLASNAIGTINDYKQIIRRAKKVGALVVVDAVHAVPHFAVDFKEIGADFLFCSAYKFFGPHIGIVAIKENVFEELKVFRLQPAPKKAPDKLETGTLNFEGLVGVTEAIRFMARLGEGNLLREKLRSAYEKMETYEKFLADRLRNGLAQLDHVTLYQAGSEVKKTPTVSFTVKNIEGKLVCHHLAQKYALHLEYGDFYAKTLVERLNAANGGLVRAGIAPYNTAEEIDRLLQGVKELTHI